VIRDQDSHSPLTQAGNQLLQIGHRNWIHPRERLIEQEVTGTALTHSQGASHFAASAFASGELLTAAVLEGREVEFLHQGIQPPPALLAGDPNEPPRNATIVVVAANTSLTPWLETAVAEAGEDRRIAKEIVEETEDLE
jgi:hypothetical protein